MNNIKNNIYKKGLIFLKNFFKHSPSTKEALIEILRNAENKSLLDADALLMIEGALHVSETHVRDIMVPRVQMIIIDHKAKPEDILSSVVESGHSRFPVIGDTNDEIVGVLLAKDLLNYYADPKKVFDIKDMMRSTVFIPESKRVNVLLREFRMSRNHMAIVVDEYNGIAGLVTIEDVIEEIIGEIEDEHDHGDNEVNINIHDNNRYTVKALTPINEFNQFFDTKIQDDEYETVGGFVINAFGYLPKRGETTNFDKFAIKVLRADKRRVKLLLFTQVKSDNLLESKTEKE
tara:strand:- start:3982 stop:4851 length:870 start_codon:yes stop_codon:yes gene_type:complete